MVKLSVLMSAYNAEKYVREALESILNQTFQDFELIVADDGSEDGTRGIIDEYAERNLVVTSHNEENQGKVATVNRLLQQARGEYVSVHDADDISRRDRFYTQISYLEKHMDVALCGTNFVSFKDNFVISKSDVITQFDELKTRIQTESVFHGPTLVFRREIPEKVGGLYRYFRHGEDIDFTMRVTEAFKTVNLEDHLYLYRYVGSALTKKVDYFNVDRMVNWKLIYSLADQRKHRGSDLVMEESWEELDTLRIELRKDFQKDNSSFSRFGAFYMLHQKMWTNSLKLAFRALKESFDIDNVKCLIMVLFVIFKDTVKGQLKRREKIEAYL